MVCPWSGQDPFLDRFFTLTHVLEEYTFPFRLKDVILTESNMESELKSSVGNLRVASLEPLVAFSHQVLNKLIRLIVHPPVIGGQTGNCTPPALFLPLPAPVRQSALSLPTSWVLDQLTRGGGGWVGVGWACRHGRGRTGVCSTSEMGSRFSYNHR